MFMKDKVQNVQWDKIVAKVNDKVKKNFWLEITKALAQFFTDFITPVIWSDEEK